MRGLGRGRGCGVRLGCRYTSDDNFNDFYLHLQIARAMWDRGELWVVLKFLPG